MKSVFSTTLCIALLCPVFLFAAGCGGKSTEATAVGSQDEMTQYLEEHPELKDAKEDTVTATGGV
jgi:hypothetical protein